MIFFTCSKTLAKAVSVLICGMFRYSALSVHYWDVIKIRCIARVVPFQQSRLQVVCAKAKIIPYPTALQTLILIMVYSQKQDISLLLFFVPTRLNMHEIFATARKSNNKIQTLFHSVGLPCRPNYCIPWYLLVSNMYVWRYFVQDCGGLSHRV